MKKFKLAVTAAATAALAAVLLPAPAASAGQVPCGDPNFVDVTYHGGTASTAHHSCFAGAGWNSFVGDEGETSWMDRIRTGNNDVAFRDCNGALIDIPRGYDVRFTTARCLRDVGIKPF
jgi:hypothetical protein